MDGKVRNWPPGSCTSTLSLRNLNIGAQVIYKVSSLVEVVARQK